MPAFILGLGNKITEDIRLNFTAAARKEASVITVFGDPIDYADLLAEKPRPTLYKKAADRFMKVIAQLSERERELRADIVAGRIGSDDKRWLANLGAGKLYAREA